MEGRGEAGAPAAVMTKRGDDTVARRGHGIKVYKAQKIKKKNSREKLMAVCFSSVSVSFLGAAWWNAFLSVFPLEVSETRLYGGLCLLSLIVSFLAVCAGKWAVVPEILAGAGLWWLNETFGHLSGAGEAVLNLPVLILWTFVFLSGKGKLAAGLALAAPFAAGAWNGYLPSAKSSWILVFAGTMYYAVGASGISGTQKRSGDAGPGKMRAGARRMAALLFTAVGLIFLIWISVSAGRFLDTGRQEEGSVYQTVRARIHTDLIGSIERMTGSGTGDGEERPVPGEETPQEEIQREQTQQEQINNVLAGDDQREELSGGEPVSSAGSMDHLKEIRAFVPETPETPLTVSVQEKPAGTVYVPVRTGTAYTGERWERGSDPKAVLSEDMPEFLEDCLMLPGGLDRLEELCEYWDTGSGEAVGRQIDEAFETMAVYDTAPGPVPGAEDFAEYFLFENHRGFCVHFATTAALLYRMCGYPSVYIEGYAVPASAFEQGEDGTWQAQVEGSMGHAWCQVYEGTDRGWVNKEHTPASRGNGNAAEQLRDPETGQGTEKKTDQRTGFVWKAAAALLAGLSLFSAGAAVLIRAAFRRKRFRQEISDAAEGNGLPAMYAGAVRLVRLARRRNPGVERRKKLQIKKEKEDIYGKEGLKLLKKECPEVSAEEWDWFYEQVMRALYYHPKDGREARKRALRLYGKCADSAWERMTAGRRLLCRYIYDISQGTGKTVEKEKIRIRRGKDDTQIYRK